MGKERILVVEDEADIMELVRYNLHRDGFIVQGAESAEQALQQIPQEPPDLILLDLMLPGMDGFELCKTLKRDARTWNIPIVILTARGEEPDVVTGLELGADDYIVKPFTPRVLSARIRNVLRRMRTPSRDADGEIVVHQLAVHPGKHEARIGNRKLELTTTEFRILSFLTERPGWVFTRGQIVDRVQGFDFAVTDRTIDVHVAALRKKLGEHAEYIETVRGVGYKIRE